MRHSHIASAAFALSTLFVQSAVLPPAIAAESSNGGKAQANAQILIKASPKVVWRAVHAERNQNPDVAYSKILNEGANTETIEQKFTNIPILGSVTAVTHQVEVPLKSIDYKMVRSDKFKAFEGSWQFAPANGGKDTILKLSSHLDVGVPFSSFFIKNATKKKIERRLANVKKIAEKEQARIAVGGNEEL